jgi:hypothetical protein
MRITQQLVRLRFGAAMISALIALSAVLGSGIGVAAMGASVKATTGIVLRHFTPIYMGGHATVSQSQAIALAQEFDVIAEQGGTFAPYLAAMHAANPALKIVAYVNAAFDITTGGTAYPAAWYAHDSGGNRI